MWEELARNFQDGDILYGLDRGRGEAKSAILRHRGTVGIQARWGFWKTTKQFERIIIQNDITNSVFDPTRSGLRSDKEIKKMAGTTVLDICTREPVTVSEETPLDEIASIMAEKHFHTLPVLHEGKVVGVVGKSDIIRTMARP